MSTGWPSWKGTVTSRRRNGEGGGHGRAARRGGWAGTGVPPPLSGRGPPRGPGGRGGPASPGRRAARPAAPRGERGAWEETIPPRLRGPRRYPRRDDYLRVGR